MGRLTEKQERVLQFIKDFTWEHGYPPSVREICTGVGLRSPSSVHAHLKALENAGYLEREGSKTRALTMAGGNNLNAHVHSVPILGRVAAGSPILAVQEIEGYLPFDAGQSQRELFALRVRGDSMINAGILPGDLIVVAHQSTARHGEIVVAMIDDEATVKRLKKQNGEVWLMPENPAYQPIDGRNAKLLGCVIANVRFYNER